MQLEENQNVKNAYDSFLPLYQSFQQWNADGISFQTKLPLALEKLDHSFSRAISFMDEKDILKTINVKDLWTCKTILRSLLVLCHKCDYKCEIELDEDEEKEKEEDNPELYKIKIEKIEKLQRWVQECIQTIKKHNQLISRKIHEVDVNSFDSGDFYDTDSDFSYDSMDSENSEEF